MKIWVIFVLKPVDIINLYDANYENLPSIYGKNNTLSGGKAAYLDNERMSFVVQLESEDDIKYKITKYYNSKKLVDLPSESQQWITNNQYNEKDEHIIPNIFHDQGQLPSDNLNDHICSNSK